MSGAEPNLTGPLPSLFELPGETCAAHPARKVVALCRMCHALCCAECATRIDGVNHCARCLVRLYPPRPVPPPPFRAFAARARLPRSFLRVSGALLFYFFVLVLAAGWGIAEPFFANERRLEANRERVVEVHLAVSAYFNDVGKYPPAERGLDALLAASAADRDFWAGPYTTPRAPAGRAAREPGDEGGVLDVFGRPVLYWSSGTGSGALPEEKIYLASPGANGAWDTPGIENGNAPREANGDDVLHWITWP